MEIWNLLSDINAEAGGLYCRVKKIITDLYVLYKIIDFIHTRRVRACVCVFFVCVCLRHLQTASSISLDRFA